MRVSGYTITLQELPGEINLCYTVTGCPLKCKGCHSSYTWKEGTGIELTDTLLNDHLNRYQGLISCVLFMGGEWEPSTLLQMLSTIQARSLRTALYTGLELEDIPQELLQRLTYLKYGPWISDRGGLKSNTTNQRLLKLPSYTDITYIFRK